MGAAHKIKIFTWGFLEVVIQVFPHKIKNPVLGKSISTVEKDHIHGSVSWPKHIHSGKGHIHRSISIIGGPGRGISMVGRIPQLSPIYAYPEQYLC